MAHPNGAQDTLYAVQPHPATPKRPPLYEQLLVVGGLAAFGGGLGYLAWAFASFVRPDLTPKRTAFIEHGMGLLFAGALSWVLSSYL